MWARVFTYNLTMISAMGQLTSPGRGIGIRRGAGQNLSAERITSSRPPPIRQFSGY
jgi:hypothetical protein